MADGDTGFEYTDNSVIGRVSIEVPPQSLTDLAQITTQVGALRTELESAARANGSWLDYLREVPAITERANQAYREMVTNMERIAYVQQEMGGGMGNVGTTQMAGPQGGGYSTAAPAGYINPFQGMHAGMGMGDMAAGQSYMGAMAAQDPRLYANMMAARGQAVNPALLGMIGGVAAGAMGQGGIGPTGGGQGYGNAAPGSQSSQATQPGRDASAPPDPTQSGAPTTSEPQNMAAEPHPDAPPWQKTVAATIGGAQQIVNESKLGGGRGGGMLGLASSGLNAASKYIANNPGALSGIAGRLGGVAKGAGAVGLGLMANHLIQNVGEEMTKYTQLGSVQGGGMTEGVGYEMQARIQALNPFITTEQSRQVMQMALREGFRGGNFDTVQGFMIDNFKNLGISFADQMDLIKSSVYKVGDTGPGFKENMDSLQSTLKVMHALSGAGGGSLPERIESLKDTSNILGPLGLSMDNITRSSLSDQQSFPNDPDMRKSYSRMTGQAAQSPMLLSSIAQKAGVTGFLPSVLPLAMEQAGYDSNQQKDMILDQIFDWAQGMGGGLNSIGAFHDMATQNGIQMDISEAQKLYNEIADKKRGGTTIGAEASKSAVANAGHQSSGLNRMFSKFGDALSAPFTAVKHLLSAPLDAIHGDFSGALANLKGLGGDAMKLAPPMPDDVNPGPRQAEETRKLFASRGNPPPDSTGGVPPTINTEGNVTGNVTITIDQQGRASAPPSIQLSGQQKSANAGYGSSQLNNAPPGDPTYNHAYNGWSG